MTLNMMSLGVCAPVTNQYRENICPQLEPICACGYGSALINENTACRTVVCKPCGCWGFTGEKN